MRPKIPAKQRSPTKGRFTVSVPTQVSTFRLDNKWKKKANPDAWKDAERRERHQFHNIKMKHEAKKL